MTQEEIKKKIHTLLGCVEEATASAQAHLGGDNLEATENRATEIEELAGEILNYVNDLKGGE